MGCKGLILLLGESFRLGGQSSRNIGSDESFEGQMKASKSHILFIENLKQKGCDMDIYLSSYNTKFNNELLDIYEKYSIGYDLYNERIGVNKLLHNSISKIKDIYEYDYIFYMRIDLFLKEEFLNIFNPKWEMIMFPSICFMPHHKHGIHPRVSDTMLFIPKKYYNYIQYVIFTTDGHELWMKLIDNAKLTYSDMDTMLNTYHESDSAKDFNPIYYIVNRPECTKFHTPGVIFDKFNFK
jgi:hypothetical protein